VECGELGRSGEELLSLRILPAVAAAAIERRAHCDG